MTKLNKIKGTQRFDPAQECLLAYNKLRKGKALRKHSLHGNIAAYVLLNLFISGNARCHITPTETTSPVVVHYYCFLIKCPIIFLSEITINHSDPNWCEQLVDDIPSSKLVNDLYFTRMKSLHTSTFLCNFIDIYVGSHYVSLLNSEGNDPRWTVDDLWPYNYMYFLILVNISIVCFLCLRKFLERMSSKLGQGPGFAGEQGNIMSTRK